MKSRLKFWLELVGLLAAIALCAIYTMQPEYSRRLEPASMTSFSGKGAGYIATLGFSPKFPYQVISDKEGANGSELQLYEDGVRLAYPHSVHADVDGEGRGRFSHWGGDVFFSASDNSDPRSNGRAYTVEVRSTISPWVLQALAALLGLGVVAALWNAGCRAACRVVPLVKWLLFTVPPAVVLWSWFAPLQSIDIPVDRMQPYGGHGYVWQIPAHAWWGRFVADENQSPKASDALLSEDGKPLMPPHADHYLIARNGAGRFSHWQDTVVFSSTDNSDPRVNGRRYTFLVPMLPGRTLVWLSLGIFVWQLYLLSMRARVFRVCIGVLSVGILVLAIGATASRFVPMRGDTVVDRSVITSIAPLKKFPERKYYRASIREFRQAFFEVNLESQPFRRTVEVLVGDEPPLKAHLGKEDGTALTDPSAQFSIGFGEFKFSAASELGDRPVRFRAPMSVTPGGVWLLWGLLGLMVWWWYRVPSLSLQPRTVLARLLAESGAFVGGSLIALSTFGAVISMGQEDLSFLQKKSNFGEHDRTLSWDQTKGELLRLRTLADQDEVILGAAHLVSERIVHNWFYVNVEELRLQVPIYENWMLWLRGELLPNYRQYNFGDYMRTLERGVGNCGQASMALIGLLSSLGVECKIWGFDGHTIVWAKSTSGNEYLLDSDYGVFWKGSFEEFVKEPGLTERYTAAFDRMGTTSDKRVVEIDRVRTTFNAGPPKPSTLPEFHGTESSAVEQFAYQIKWLGPIGLVALFFIMQFTLRLRRT